MSHGARAWATLATVYVLWGSTYLGIELVGETMPPVLAAGVRFLLAGSILAAWVAWRRGTAALRPARPQLLSAALVGVLLPGANALLFIAERDVPTGLTSLLIASVPLWIVVLRLATRERQRAVTLAATCAGFAGVALLLRPGDDAGAVGLALVLCSAVAWAVGSFLSARLPMPPDAFGATAIEMLVGGVVLIPVGLVAALASGEPLDPGDWSGRSLFGFAYLVVVGSIVGYTAYVWLLANMPIATVSTYAYVNPIVAVALGAIVLDEALGWSIAAGAVVVLASVALVIREESRAP